MPRARLSPAYLCTFYLPVRYNPDDPISPGSPIEVDKYAAVEERLLARFGGLSRQLGAGGATVWGRWLHEDVLYEDQLVAYSVITDRSPESREWFTAYCDELCRAFRQFEIFLIVTATSVARYPPEL